MASDPYGSPDDGLELERIAVRDAVHMALMIALLTCMRFPGRPLLPLR
jgi:hypothetical protein